MEDSYESITSAMIAILETMAAEPTDTAVCLARDIYDCACNVAWSWRSMVGHALRQSDIDRVERLLKFIDAHRCDGPCTPLPYFEPAGQTDHI